MTFEVPADYSGWPAQTHLFGYSTETSHQETVSINSDLIQLDICHDSSAFYPENDFEGFILHEYSGTVTELHSKCTEFVSIDLGRQRLVGFEIVASDYKDGL